MILHRTPGGGLSLSRDREVEELQMNLESTCGSIRAIRHARKLSEEMFDRHMQIELEKKDDLLARLAELNAARFERTKIKSLKEFYAN